MEGTSVLSGVTGGLGLFLLGLWLATDGLKVAGGGVLRAHLGEWTRGRWRSFETGFAISILLPSWDGLTRAAMGLVNDERVTLQRALWVVIGSGFGAVMTAWVVVGIGFSPFLLPLALGLLGLGVLLRWTGQDTRRGSWGRVLVGTGVLFLGVRILATTASLLNYRLDTFAVDPLWRILGCALAGTVLAVGMASTSAVVVLVLVATAAGAIDITSAAALLVGANFGAIAGSARIIWRGTPDVRRVAVGHAVFHASGSGFGLFLLICMLPTVRMAHDPRGSTLLLLAAFQTFFCIVGAVLVRLTEGRLLAFLGKHFHPTGAESDRSQRLDATVITVPELALEGIAAEVRRISAVTLGLAQKMFARDLPSEFRVRRDLKFVSSLAREVDEYTVQLFHTPLPPRIANALLDTARAVHVYRTIGERMIEVRERLAEERDALDQAVMNRLRQYQHPLLHLLQSCRPFRQGFDIQDCQADLETVDHHVRDLQRRLLAQRTTGIADNEALEIILERLGMWRTIGRQAVDAAEILARVGTSTGSTIPKRAAAQDSAALPVPGAA